MDAMAAAIKEADCYVIVTPEYNHSIPPALSSMMGQCSKPSPLPTPYNKREWGPL